MAIVPTAGYTLKGYCPGNLLNKTEVFADQGQD